MASSAKRSSPIEAPLLLLIDEYKNDSQATTWLQRIATAMDAQESWSSELAIIDTRWTAVYAADAKKIDAAKAATAKVTTLLSPNNDIEQQYEEVLNNFKRFQSDLFSEEAKALAKANELDIGWNTGISTRRSNALLDTLIQTVENPHEKIKRELTVVLKETKSLISDLMPLAENEKKYVEDKARLENMFREITSELEKLQEIKAAIKKIQDEKQTKDAYQKILAYYDKQIQHLEALRENVEKEAQLIAAASATLTQPLTILFRTITPPEILRSIARGEFEEIKSIPSQTKSDEKKSTASLAPINQMLFKAREIQNSIQDIPANLDTTPRRLRLARLQIKDLALEQCLPRGQARGSRIMSKLFGLMSLAVIGIGIGLMSGLTMGIFIPVGIAFLCWAYREAKYAKERDIEVECVESGDKTQGLQSRLLEQNDKLREAATPTLSDGFLEWLHGESENSKLERRKIMRHGIFLQSYDPRVFKTLGINIGVAPTANREQAVIVRRGKDEVAYSQLSIFRNRKTHELRFADGSEVPENEDGFEVQLSQSKVGG